jgi:glycosyltransferase involved in cell wall biosynthesis
VHNPDVELYERARRRRLSVRMVRCEGRADLHAVSEIRQHVRADQSDIIHTHGYKADLYGYLAARAEKKPIVATCHNWIDGTPALGLFNRLDRLILRKFSSVAAVSPAVADKLCASGVSTEKISTIANGIDVECFVDAQPACFTLSAMPTRPIVGIVARLDLQKGFNPLLEAIATLKPKYPELLLVIVGDGPDRRAVENMVAQL